MFFVCYLQKFYEVVAVYLIFLTFFSLSWPETSELRFKFFCFSTFRKFLNDLERKKITIRSTEKPFVHE